MLVILEKRGNLKPSDAEIIAKALKAHFRSCVVRVASHHLEIALETELPAEEAVTILNALGRPLEVREGGRAPLGLRELLRAERFWEAHEVLEGLWRSSSGERKVTLRRAIGVVAALTKAQEGKPEAAIEILRRAGEEGCVEAVLSCSRGEEVGAAALECLERFFLYIQA